MVDLIEKAFIEGQIDGQEADLAYELAHFQARIAVKEK
jgi:hypothetical protein